MSDVQPNTGWSVWGVLWRIGLLIAIALFWTLPEAWLDSAHHFGGELLLVLPVANLAGWIAPLAAFVDAVRLLVRRRGGKSTDPGWSGFRLAWIGIVLVHFGVFVSQL